jgi:hypothetical protein
MKSFMILGSVIGFLIGAGFSLAGECPFSTALWRACLSALVAAVLARWWSSIWYDGLQNAIENRRNAARVVKSEVKPPAKV